MPMHGALVAMGCSTGHFGDRRKRQVGADSHRWRNAEQQGEQRRHQRTTADARQADQDADRKTCNNIRKSHSTPRK